MAGTLTPAARTRIAALLGREPRGLEAIAVAKDDGEPQVIRVASLVDDRPFPTLFWLVDPDICYRLDQLEAGGLIARLQQRVDSEPELQQSMIADHQAHIQLRDRYISDAQRQRLVQLNYERVLSSKGIGGIADFSRIRCLHTWFAAHLVEPNTIGLLLETHLAEPVG